MKKSKNRCLLCGGKLVPTSSLEKLSCLTCDTEYDSKVFVKKEYDGRNRSNFSLLKLFFAFLGAIYLIYLVLRIFYY
ncbi:MAG: hypothetical protein ACFFAS_15700 [Promethearchaeota archaeon]